MKTTTTVNGTQQTTDQKNQLNGSEYLGPLRSLRPQKSMVKVKSLKPKRVIGQRRLSIRSGKLS